MTCLREEVERREEGELAPWAMKSADSRGREYPEQEHEYRTAYQRDRDRIIHCKAFRRLEYKTQVFLNHEGDHYRTRLTHTLEVAQIARTIARALKLNEDLTEAIALSHDLGHTPFGHSGERALREVMEGRGGFEHNRHGLRVVDTLERQYRDFPGLNLTYEVRESIAKHATRWDNPESHDFEPGPPLLEAQIVEVADSVAYDNHDLDDGLSAGIISRAELEDMELWARAERKIRRERGQKQDELRDREIIRYLINLFCSDLIEETARRIEQCDIQSAAEVRQQEGNLVDFSPPVRKEKQKLEDFLFNSLYRDHRVVRQITKAERFVREIFNAYVADSRQLPPEYQEWAERVGLHQAVCDYIAGMTDRYAQDQYLQLFQPYQKL